MTEFPISGVETYWWLPALVAFCISSFTSTGGVTGAFIVMPFQVSVLGYTSPGASPTNLIYNIIAIPSGVYQYHREGRMLWALAWATTIGTVPGLVVGAILHVKLLPDPRSFKFFIGLVLLALAVKLTIDILSRRAVTAGSGHGPATVCFKRFDRTRLIYEYGGQDYEISTLPVVITSFFLGVVGGAYGIGGGALLAPFFVTVYRLPVHSIAGAMLLGTWIASVVGVLVYLAVGYWLTPSIETVMPDWLLGLSFGMGGLAGVYVGARLQKYVSVKVIKIILAAGLLAIAGRYVIGYFS